jgi:hypothetical protein
MLSFDVYVVVHRDKFLIIGPTRCTSFSKFLFWNETLHVSDSSSVHHQEFSIVNTAMGCHAGLLQAVSKPVWNIPLLCVQWKIPDDGQRNCPKHIEFYSRNKFENLVHLVGFIIRIYHGARSSECQFLLSALNAFASFAVKVWNSVVQVALAFHLPCC